MRPTGPARNSVGRFTHRGIRAHLNLKENHVARVIASENTVVFDDALQIHRQLIAGLEVPPDLVDAYRQKVGGAKAAADPGEDARADAGYDSKSAKDLQDEVDRRNASRDDDAKIVVEGTGSSGNVVKTDLVKALTADDDAAS